MNKKVFIVANKVGADHSDYIKCLNATTDMLSGIGFEVTNPENKQDIQMAFSLDIELKRPKLQEADFVFLMENWEKCPIAQALQIIAHENNKEIVPYELFGSLEC